MECGQTAGFRIVGSLCQESINPMISIPFIRPDLKSIDVQKVSSHGVDRVVLAVVLLHVGQERETFVERRGRLSTECCGSFEEPFEDRHGTGTTSLFSKRAYYGARVERQSRSEIDRNGGQRFGIGLVITGIFQLGLRTTLPWCPQLWTPQRGDFQYGGYDH
jgi:hypothetical protein